MTVWRIPVKDPIYRAKEVHFALCSIISKFNKIQSFEDHVLISVKLSNQYTSKLQEKKLDRCSKFFPI